ncbi:MAG: hypothetical protein NC453_14695 [Muribaculum sp.]|nr:hypothetical protein [Muribaculum sp.]
MKIVFLTFHNWVTKRIGGFHKLAESAAKAGHEVIFFSFDRPYFTALKHEERLNRHVLITLSKGITYQLDDNGHKITNCTWPSLRLPNIIHKRMPDPINHWLQTHSLTPFSKIQSKYFDDTDVFVFESCEAVELLDLVKANNPDAKIVYRPSDPMMTKGCPESLQTHETRLLQAADMNFIVNRAGIELYKSKIPDFEKTVRYMLLPNGVDTSLFKKEYPCPDILKKKNTILYVGARVIEWNLIKKAARLRPDYNFIVVCPEIPPADFKTAHPNLQYIPGIKPADVPAWVCNADVVIVPNPQGWYKLKPWGITAKYYQAMEARRPIVAYEDTDELSEYGVYVAHDYDRFISMLDEAMLHSDGVSYNFKAENWNKISETFLTQIAKL